MMRVTCVCGKIDESPIFSSRDKKRSSILLVYFALCRLVEHVVCLIVRLCCKMDENLNPEITENPRKRKFHGRLSDVAKKIKAQIHEPEVCV